MRGQGYWVGGSVSLARRCATANPQGMLSRRTSARPSRSGASRAAPAARHATVTAAHVRASGWYKLGSRCQACRLAATSMVAHSTTAAPAHSIHAVAAGVRPSWAWWTRLTIAAPIAAMAAVSGRWLSIHCRLAGQSVDDTGEGFAEHDDGEQPEPFDERVGDGQRARLRTEGREDDGCESGQVGGVEQSPGRQ